MTDSADATPTSDPIAFTPDGEPNVIDMHAKVIEQNAALIEQLNAVGQPPNRLMFVETQIETLLDVLFDDSEQLTHFHAAVDLGLNRRLRAVIDGLTSALVLPDDV